MLSKNLNAIKFILLFLVALAFAIPTSAFAQNIFTQAVELTKSALEDYDFVELESAETKITQAIKLVESGNINNPGVANIYISQGVIAYGLYKDSDPVMAVENAKAAFAKAVALNPSITIHPDYRTSELEALLDESRNAYLAAQPPTDETTNTADAQTAGEETQTAQNDQNEQTAEQQPEVQTPPQPEVKPVTIRHSAVGAGDKCKPLTIRASVPEHPDVAHITVHYADAIGIPYNAIEMTPTDVPDEYTAVIPEVAMRNERIRYYIEVTDQKGGFLTSYASSAQPVDSMILGECALPDSDKKNSEYGEPIFQLSLLFGTGFGYVHGDTLRCESNRRCNPQINPGADETTKRYTGASAGMSTLPFHIRLNADINLPANFQIGLYLRLQAVNYADEDALNNILFGLALRYFVLHDQPYRLYLGVGIGYGGANATVFLGKEHDNFRDIYVYDGPVHIAPQIGFLLTLHKNVGLAFDLNVPIYFPNRPSFHFDISVGPFFQF